MPLDLRAVTAQMAGRALPAPAPPPTPGLAAIGLEQFEHIGTRELGELARKLVKRKSEKHQAYGRALSNALQGLPFCEPTAGRNNLLFEIAGEIIEAFPYANPEGIVDAFHVSLDRLAEDSLAAGISASNPAPTRAEFAAMLLRFQAPKQKKHAGLAALEADYQTALATLPPIGEREAQVWNLPTEAVNTPPTTGLDYRSIIVHADGVYYLRHPQASVYPTVAGSDRALRLELQRKFLDLRGSLGLTLVDDAGEMLETDKILRSYATNARLVIYDYAATETEFDTATCALRKGFTMGRMNDGSLIEPLLSERVEAWLNLLAGGTEPDLLELYDWIAATDQRHVTTNAAALVIVGDPGVGKTVFARALARTWGQTEPVKFGAVVDRFNGILTRCPIWFADEKMPDDLDDATFREIVQQEQRDVEFKGRERMICRGTARILIGLNQIEDLHIQASSGPAGARAVADRLAVYTTSEVQATKRALLAISGDRRAEQVLEIARHLRWVQVNVTPREQRFLGARGDTSQALKPILEAASVSAPKIFETLRTYFDDPIAWEREYSVIDQLSAPGRRFSVACETDAVGDPVIWINLAEICARAGIPDRDQRWTRGALRPFAKRMDPNRLRFCSRAGMYRGYYVALDPDRLASVLGEDVDLLPAFLPGTRARCIGWGAIDP